MKRLLIRLISVESLLISLDILKDASLFPIQTLVEVGESMTKDEVVSKIQSETGLKKKDISFVTQWYSDVNYAIKIAKKLGKYNFCMYEETLGRNAGFQGRDSRTMRRENTLASRDQ